MEILKYLHYTLFVFCFLIKADFGLSFMPQLGKAKILHIGFHTGCIKDIEGVVYELHARGVNIDLTSWNIGAIKPREHFDGKTTGNAIWNISYDRAEDVWHRHKDFFNQFDIIITSDTAPLSRVFLQNNHWKKPLIIWVCNRFDYADHMTRDHSFPDKAYYQMFQEAAHMPNVRIIPYTDYEWYYAERKGLNIGRRTIRPLGSMDDDYRFGKHSLIPEDVDPSETLFIYPRLNNQQMQFAKSICDSLDIKCHTGKYNGPGELAKYKAVLYFPYAWSNLALYENLQRGIIHFVPSINFVKSLVNQGYPIRTFTTNLFEMGEWYKSEYKDVFVYFDSWSDLKNKFNSLDYLAMQKKVKKFGAKHRENVLNQWEEVFSELIPFI